MSKLFVDITRLTPMLRFNFEPITFAADDVDVDPLGSVVTTEYFIAGPDRNETSAVVV